MTRIVICKSVPSDCSSIKVIHLTNNGLENILLFDKEPAFADARVWKIFKIQCSLVFVIWITYIKFKVIFPNWCSSLPSRVVLEGIFFDIRTLIHEFVVSWMNDDYRHLLINL